MSIITARTPAEMAAGADSILAAMGAPGTWPQHPHAQAAVGYAYDRADECRVIYDRLLNGDLRPDQISPNDLMAGDPQEHAEEWAADEYLEAAKTARNRLAEFKRHEGRLA